MLIKVNKYFEVEVTRGEFYLKLPWIGHCHYVSWLGFSWDSWRQLKKYGEV